MSGPYLATSLRKALAKTIDQARKVAEAGAAEAIRRLGVAETKAPAHLDEGGKRLRNALRAHARVLGDRREASGEQAVAKLKEATAYEHWHRMLFARFLAERGLLIHPGYRAPVSLEDCKDLAAEEGLPDAWAVAERYATRMLPGIFRPDDPSLALTLAPEDAAALRGLVLGLEPAVFAAADSLGWTYQFWRAAEKDAVNERMKAGGKVGANELPAVTQLFTEPYMVQFLLHNTLGAWWAGKWLAAEPTLAGTAGDEATLRAAVSLPGIDWGYLRFVQEDGVWRPAAGTFPGWPEHAAFVTVMDPCCGSGHFLVEALGILAAMRISEEKLAPAEAVGAVLRDNLFGLEIDGRCVQIAAFAVALAAWRLTDAVIDLPRPHIAWVGQVPAVGRTEWVRLAEAISAAGPLPPKRDLLGTEDNLFSTPDRWALELLWDFFGQASVLGSLLDLGTIPPLFVEQLAGFEAALTKAAFRENESDELALAARGMADAARMLAGHYTLQVTNVPFLAAGKMAPGLRKFVEEFWSIGKADLATVMLLRMRALARIGGSVAAVTPQNWYFLGSYRKLRETLLTDATLNAICDLGPAAFHDMNWWAARTALTILTNSRPQDISSLFGIDAQTGRAPEIKERSVRETMLCLLDQSGLSTSTNSQITTKPLSCGSLLRDHASVRQGIFTGDLNRFVFHFWETNADPLIWDLYQMAPERTALIGGLHSFLRWDRGAGPLATSSQARICGSPAWGRRGVAVGVTSQLYRAAYFGTKFDGTLAAVVPHNEKELAAIFVASMDDEFPSAVRTVDQALSVTESAFGRIAFDVVRWSERSDIESAFPEPYSEDPTQWLFHGHPAHANAGAAIHIALARLAGYRWPAETYKTMQISAETRDRIADVAILPYTNPDAIQCLPSVGGGVSLVERLRAYLATAFGPSWSADTERRLLAEAAEVFNEQPPADLEDWLRHRCFRQHCVLFHHRPFLWHVWDGQRDGFAVMLHYHRLTKATLQKLTYTVLGDWLVRMKALGDARRLEAARILQQKLELILTGETPYDVFVRWKPPAHQPLGWDPDLDDGVRMNIRPFVTAGILRDTPNIKWGKDRGTDVATAPWYHLGPEKGGKPGDRINDHHTTLAEKQAARDAARKAS